MVRGNGSARAETSVKATARPNTIRITMRHGPLRDTLDDDLSTITIPPFVTYIGLAWERSFSFGSGCAAEQRHNLHGGFRSRRQEQTSRNRVPSGQCVTTEGQPRRGLV
jgi:hypothetical protein